MATEIKSLKAQRLVSDWCAVRDAVVAYVDKGPRDKEGMIGVYVRLHSAIENLAGLIGQVAMSFEAEANQASEANQGEGAQ